MDRICPSCREPKSKNDFIVDEDDREICRDCYEGRRIVEGFEMIGEDE